MRVRHRHVDVRLVAVVTVAVVAALVVAALALRSPEAPVVADRPPPTEQVGPEREPSRELSRYVAMGDSWASGAGLELLRGSTADAACRRSASTYAQLVARDLDLSLEDRTCVGAAPEAVALGQSRSGIQVPSQLEPLSRRVDLVTISVGADEADLVDRTVSACQELAPRDPSGSPCRDVFGEDGLSEVAVTAAQAAAKTERLLREVATRAPGARLLVVGYANVFPDGASCFERTGIADGDLAYLRTALESIVGATRSAADAVGAEYVDPEPAFRGHLVCSRSAYVVPGDEGGPAFRLTPDGHRALADSVVRVLATDRPDRSGGQGQ